MRTRLTALFCALFLLTLAAVDPASAQQRDPRWGTIYADIPAAAMPRAPIELGKIRRSNLFREAMVVSSGVALRNRPGGAISVSGVTGPVRRAFIYWAVIGSPVPDAAKSINIRRLLPSTSPVKTIAGAEMGSGFAPCWQGGSITVFRGTIPLSVAEGNGTYLVTLNAGAAGLTGGEDPWVQQSPPQWEGASIVMIGTGNGTVAIYDQGLSASTLAAVTPDDFLAYTLVLPLDILSAQAVHWHVIGADGQRGDSALIPSPLVATERTIINGTNVAGADSDSPDSHWNGHSGTPLPRLWDNDARDITAAAKAGNGTTLRIREVSPGDCISTVANVVAIH
jgi:hypothetical protein